MHRHHACIILYLRGADILLAAMRPTARSLLRVAVPPERQVPQKSLLRNRSARPPRWRRRRRRFTPTSPLLPPSRLRRMLPPPPRCLPLRRRIRLRPLPQANSPTLRCSRLRFSRNNNNNSTLPTSRCNPLPLHTAPRPAIPLWPPPTPPLKILSIPPRLPLLLPA